MSFKNFFSLSAILSVFSLDRLFKILILRHYSEGSGFTVLPGIFHITRVNNTGAAFGILKHSGLLLVLISVASIFFLSLCLIQNIILTRGKQFRYFGADPGSEVAWALVIGGAMGNLYDRLCYGYVVDFLDFRVWPVFNIADASICVGVFLIVLSFFRKREVR